MKINNHAIVLIELEPGDTGDDLRDAIYDHDCEPYRVSVVNGAIQLTRPADNN